MSEDVKPVVLLVPILNFDCEVDKIVLDKSHLIRRDSNNEIENMILKFPNSKMLRSAIGDAKFLLELKGTSEEIFDVTFSPETADANLVITSLRLLNVGWTPMLTAFYISVDSLLISDPYPKRYYPLNKYSVLSKEKTEEFKLLWKVQKNIYKKKPHLVFALKQFNKSFQNYGKEEIVDYITAFESIVFGRGTNPPSPYGRAIGIAIGMLIGKNEKERTQIEQRLNEAYEIRNKIVHGHLQNKINAGGEKRFSDLLAFTKECLIQSLIKLLKE